MASQPAKTILRMAGAFLDVPTDITHFCIGQHSKVTRDD